MPEPRHGQTGNELAELFQNQPGAGVRVVNGLRVVSIKPDHRSSVVSGGRTVIGLADGSTVYGCVDCEFTDPGRRGVTSHRNDEHGVPKWNSVKPADQAVAVEAMPEVPEPVADAVEVVVDEVPTAFRHRAEAAVNERIGELTLYDLLERAFQFDAAAQAIDSLTDDRDRWKQRALRAEKVIKAMRRAAGKLAQVGED